MRFFAVEYIMSRLITTHSTIVLSGAYISAHDYGSRGNGFESQLLFFVSFADIDANILVLYKSCVFLNKINGKISYSGLAQLSNKCIRFPIGISQHIGI